MVARKKTFYDYKAFTAKFKPKKTTDDCNTPPEIYEVIRNYVNENVLNLKGLNIVRPFYPGGDYEAYPYKENDVVIDNPPFSIFSKIIQFYLKRGIKFYLFAPHLTLFNAFRKKSDVTAVICAVSITYDNGAVVNTSFLTNLYDDSPAFVIDGKLNKLITECNKKFTSRRKIRRIQYPPTVVTSALLGKIAVRGITMKAPCEEVYFIDVLDCGQQIFGGGLLISERLAAERLAAERLIQEESTEYGLSERELKIIKNLNKRGHV